MTPPPYHFVTLPPFAQAPAREDYRRLPHSFQRGQQRQTILTDCGYTDALRP